MLFNSAAFLFVFLPIVLVGFFTLGRFWNARLAVVWTLGASLLFYSWDDPWRLLPIILCSIIFNYIVGRALTRRRSKAILWAGLSGNLLLLAYFKYAEFILELVTTTTSLPLPHVQIALPIGISFYTFTQIAFLIDVYRSAANAYEPMKYGLFVSYFPHLVAGPILHHNEIMPQFDNPSIYRPCLSNISLGLTWFAVGLFKKIMLADSIAPVADAVFDSAKAGGPVTFADAWIGTLAYTMQIYFDFSGYSDMAIGLALMMGIRFPLNFDSPYKASSLIDFWRRWHITLSRFLRDYLYISLGGNRKGPLRRHINLMLTMILGGLWHGATWNFVVWGAIHGLGLLLNHLWRDFASRFSILLPRTIGLALTFAVVILAWVPFRADTIKTSVSVWTSMSGANGLSGPSLSTATDVCIALLLSAVALFAPNTQQLLPRSTSDVGHTTWMPSLPWAMVAGGLFGIAVTGMMSKPSVFLYFRF